MNYAADLCAFLDDSSVNFYAVDTVRRRLEAEGFSELKMEDCWALEPGDRRFVVKTALPFSPSLSAPAAPSAASTLWPHTATRPASA